LPPTIRRARVSDRDAALDLLCRAFGRNVLKPEAWDWAFRRNPLAESGLYYLVAELEDRLVGQWASVPTRLQHHGEVILGLRSQNIATDHEYLKGIAEGGRPGTVLASLATRLAEEFGQDAPLSYGFPNRRSGRVLFRIGTVELTPYPLLIRPVAGIAREASRWRPWAFPAGLLAQAGFSTLAATQRALVNAGRARARRVEEFEEFGPWADRLWEEISPELGTCAVRDATFLNWRFAATPFDYRRLALAGPDGPTGFAVTASTANSGRRVVTLMELMARPGDRQGARVLIDQVVREAAALGAAGIVTLATARHPFRSVLRRAGFLPAPWAARELSFTVRILGRHTDLVPNEIFHIDDWHLSGADIDVP
jgi:Acetyltransferase (GNAT) domain